jgi:hypothetical protein
MPIFFFDLRDGNKLLIDKQGTELRDMRAAHDEAARGLSGVAWDAMRLDRAQGQQVAIEVRDAQGPVMQIKFSFEITRSTSNGH